MRAISSSIGVFARLQHPLFRRSALEYEIHLSPGQPAVLYTAIEAIPHIANAAADIVPVQRRTNDNYETALEVGTEKIHFKEQSEELPCE